MEEKKYELKNQKNQKTFIEYSQKIDGVDEKLEDYNPVKKESVDSV